MALGTIDIEDITNNVTVDSNYNVAGDGAFDKLMESVNIHIKAQFDAKRIKNTDIADMYVGIMPGVIQQAIQFAMTKELSEEKIVTEQKGQAIADEQILSEQLNQDLIRANTDLTNRKVL